MHLQAEALLGGGEDKELTDTLRGSGWPAAAQTLADLLVLDGLPEQPYRIEMGDALYVDAGGALTYASPVRLERREARSDPGSTQSRRSEETNEVVALATAASHPDGDRPAKR